ASRRHCTPAAAPATRPTARHGANGGWGALSGTPRLRQEVDPRVWSAWVRTAAGDAADSTCRARLRRGRACHQTRPIWLGWRVRSGVAMTPEWCRDDSGVV